MRLKELITFRKDLLFQGAVQISWFETDPDKSRKAAGHFIFHGPEYHGVQDNDFGSFSAYRLKDTASFTLEILNRLVGNAVSQEPITIAVAGYGTGKSHLGLTLSVLFAEPHSHTAKTIVANLKAADPTIGVQVEHQLDRLESPFLVVPINGMRDFDLVEEIRRQVLQLLRANGIDTTRLEELRPRFRKAQTFTSSFFDALKEDFIERFGEKCTADKVLERLASQDEEAFKAVSEIYEEKMGDPIRATGQESLQELLDTLNTYYCGPNRNFRGLVIIFDEFGRYLEFAVRKPHIAGRDGLQQLFEGVQNNSDTTFLICFVQRELKAYASQIAPELKDDLNRFISRYDSAPKVRLSTNLETIIANILQKNNPAELELFISKTEYYLHPDKLLSKLKKWFPDIEHHALWKNSEQFAQVVIKGCWPLHPTATWLLYYLSSVGRSLQQRSALSFLEAAFEANKNKEIKDKYWSISAVDLCSDYMVTEFLNSERYGEGGAIAHGFENAISRYQYELSRHEKELLKAVMLAMKLGLKVESQEESAEALCILAGQRIQETQDIIEKLSKEYGLLEWDESVKRYDIVSDAVPRRAFLTYLENRITQIDSSTRADLFAQNIKKWCGISVIETDFGLQNRITTPEWHYLVTCSNVQLIESHIKFAVQAWKEAIAVEECRGHAIYCYVGPESNLEVVRENICEILNKEIESLYPFSETGAPIVVILLHDEEGRLGRCIAEYWVLSEFSEDSELLKFSNFLPDQRASTEEEIIGHFSALEKKRDIISACKLDAKKGRLRSILANIFGTVYPKCIPFPFDGFHTARGNAAKNCYQFTRELFQGTLNQTSIAAYPSQLKNRAISVFQQSWKIFRRDGMVAKRPNNPQIASLISLFDTTLKDSGRLNLGSAVRMVCRPPFGCNIASAGLLLGVFVSPRKEELRFLLRGEHITIEEWLGKAFQKNFLNLAVLDETEIEKVSQVETSEWQELLDRWEIEQTYDGQLRFLEEAEILEKNVPVPHGLFYKYELMRQKAETARKKREKLEKALLKQSNFFKIAYKESDAGKLARCASELLYLARKLENEKEKWTSEEISETKDVFNTVKQAAIQFFPEWLSKQYELRPVKFGEFRHKMEMAAKNFNSLGLEELAQKIEEQLRNNIAELNRIEEINSIVKEAKAFLATAKITPASRISEIKACRSKIVTLQSELRNLGGTKASFPQLEEALKDLNHLKSECKKQLDAHTQRAMAIWNRRIFSIRDVKETAQEIRALMTIFDGQEEDINDFRVMIEVLNKIEFHYGEISSVLIDDEELERRYRKAIEETLQALNREDEIPWDIKETYKNLRLEVRKIRKEKANNWMKANMPDMQEVSELNESEVYRIREVLKSCPPYLSTAQQEQVSVAIEACTKRLMELAVDGLIEQFRNLPLNAQIKFLERARQIVNGSDSTTIS